MKEKEYELIPAEKKRNVMIVGGGISGMEAARVAKKRGHEVVIYEKSGRLAAPLPLPQRRRLKKLIKS